MAGRKKVSFDEVETLFDECKHHIPDPRAQLIPVSGDESKCVLLSGGMCEPYSCASLKGHLEFMSRTLG